MNRPVPAALRIAWQAAAPLLVAFVPLTLLGALAPVATAWLIKLILDSVTAGATLSALLWLVAGLALAGIVAGVIPHALEYLRAESDRRITVFSEDRLYAATERFVGIGRFEDPAFQDRLRLAQESGRSTPSNVINSAVGMSRGVITALGFVGSLAILDPLVTVAVVVACVPAILAERALANRRAAVLLEMTPAIRREVFYAKLLSDTRAAKEARLFGLAGFFRQRMLAERRAANAAERGLDQRELRTQGGLSLLSALVAGAGFALAIVSAGNGRLSVGDISMFVAALVGVQAALAQVVGAYAVSRRSLLVFEHYLELTQAEPELPVSPRPAAVPVLRQGIELRDVWFRYSPSHPWVLRGVNMFIPAGAATALVGRNGAGKSTIVKLLLRFYDPTKGSVQWNGVDLRDLDPAELRARIGAVFQDFMEYDLTAAENIGLADLSRLRDRTGIESAARLAGVHEAVSQLPAGYDTLLSRTFAADSGAEEWLSGGSDVGVVLSTGQWQRLALARGLFRQGSQLLILDEPSSGLDPEAEHQIHETLRTHAPGSTKVLISHRLSTTRDADDIYVLANGRVIEHGSHRGLMTAAGEYARLFTMQAQGYQQSDSLV